MNDNGASAAIGAVGAIALAGLMRRWMPGSLNKDQDEHDEVLRMLGFSEKRIKEMRKKREKERDYSPLGFAWPKRGSKGVVRLGDKKAVVAVLQTSGGKYKLEVTEDPKYPNGPYSFTGYTSGRPTSGGAGMNHDQLLKTLARKRYGAIAIDQINYIVRHDTVGFEDFWEEAGGPQAVAKLKKKGSKNAYSQRSTKSPPKKGKWTLILHRKGGKITEWFLQNPKGGGGGAKGGTMAASIKKAVKGKKIPSPLRVMVIDQITADVWKEFYINPKTLAQVSA